ncbi:MAG: putative porin [Solimonas sp.]
MKTKEHVLAGACGGLLLLGAGLQSAQAEEAAAAVTGAEKVEQAQAKEQASQAQTSAVTIALIQLLIKEGVISLDKAQALLAAAEREAAVAQQRAAPPAPSTVRVTYVPETVKKEMAAELHKDIVEQAKTERWGVPGTLPEWLDRIELGGDFRLRLDSAFMGGDNFPYYPDLQAINDAGGVSTLDVPVKYLQNTTEDRERMRYRARLNFNAKVTPGVKVGISLASGEDNGPVSTNKTFGDYERKDPVWIDRAFLEAQLGGGFTFIGGRMPNPFYSTDMLWDTDINPEGAAVKYAHNFGEGRAAGLFVNAGAFPLLESARNYDRWLYAGQVGATAPIGKTDFKLGIAYYDFDNMQSKLDPPDGSKLNDYTRPTLMAQGNSVFNIRTDGLTTLVGLASQYRILDVLAQLDVPLGDGKVVRFIADYVHNFGMDINQIRRLQGEQAIAPGDTGWQIKISAGDRKIADKGDWDASLAYKHIETDAVLDVFADSDFGVYGGTDLKGFVLEGNYGIARNLWAGFKWLSADPIERPPFASDVVLIDLNARF